MMSEGSEKSHQGSKQQHLHSLKITMSGQILGDRYEVAQQLGKQLGRWTLLASDLITGDPVVLKVIFIDENLGPHDLRLFRREIETLQTLKHPATPRYLGYFEMDLPRDGKALVLIQSYLEGQSLQHYLQKNRRLTEPEAKTVAHSVLKILSYLHDHHPPIIHRDIKPSNILLANLGGSIATHPFQKLVTYLVDFGSVKSLVSSDATTFTLVGTDGYIPPEQLGKRPVRASDLYSLGITLFTAISGILPHDLPRRGYRIQFEPLPWLSPEFQQWLKQMSEPDLGKRFSSAEAALQALMAVT